MMNENVTEGMLIELLQIRPRTEYDIGFNAAIISLLKKLQGVIIISEDSEKPISEDPIDKRFKLFNDWIKARNLEVLSHSQKGTLYSQICSNEKIAAVRFLKEATGALLQDCVVNVNLILRTFKEQGF